MAWANDQIRDLVARTLLGESDGSQEGMVSVAHVMKNRGLSGAWGAPNGGLTRLIKAHKQFSMWNTDDPKLLQLAASVNAIPTTDPRYQRAAAVADGVFSDQIPDTTNGATHYHTPDRHPDWSNGVTPVATIGGHYFYKLPLTASNTAGTAVVGPSTVGQQGPAAVSSVGAGNGFVYGGGAQQDQGIDMRHLEPVFRARIDKLRADAAEAGIATHITSAYRDNANQAGEYARLGAQHLAAAPGQSYHQFGRAVDLEADNPAQQAALVALADQPERGITAGMHFQTPDRVHFQASEGKTAQLLETPGTSLAPVDDPSAPKPLGQGGIGSDARAPLGTAPAGTPPAVSTIVPNPNIPAANAQPVSASAPAAPSDEKYPVIARMTTGTSHNPELITAANWGNLFGGAATAPSAVPPAAAPLPVPRPASAPTPAPAPVPAPTPLRNAWNDRPSGAPDPVRNAWNDRPSGQPGPPIAASEVAAPPPPPPPVAPPAPPAPPPVAAPAPPPAISPPPVPVVPPDAPRPPAAHPWDLPMSLNQPAQIPGSMLPAAQRLIAMLFGTAQT